MIRADEVMISPGIIFKQGENAASQCLRLLRGADALTCWLSEEPPWSRATLKYLYGRRTDDDTSKAWLRLDDQLRKIESHNTLDAMI